MNSERYQFINLARLPGRLTVEEAAWCLGFYAHDIPVLVTNRLLKPLGNPGPTGRRYFAACQIEQFRLDTKWLEKASALMNKHWQDKNASRKTERYSKKRPRQIAPSTK